MHTHRTCTRGTGYEKGTDRFFIERRLDPELCAMKTWSVPGLLKNLGPGLYQARDAAAGELLPIPTNLPPRR